MQPYGVRLPPGGGEGVETCYECEGDGRCLACAGRRCAQCGGSGRCVVCGGRGSLPGGTRAWLIAQGWLAEGA